MIYKYYPATKPDGTDKPGINRITFDAEGNEITREYMVTKPTGEYTLATEQEINFNQ